MEKVVCFFVDAHYLAIDKYNMSLIGLVGFNCKN